MAWSRLQSAVAACHFGTAIDSNPVTLGSNCTSGSVLLAYVQINASGAITTSTVKDGAGNSFTKLFDVENGGNSLSFSMWYIATPAGDVGTTPTITATTSAPGTAAGGLLVQEISGIQASPDGSAGTLTNATSAAGTPSGTPSYTSTAVNEFLVSYYADQGSHSETITAPTGYTADPHNVSGSTTGGNMGVAWKNSTNGLESDGWTVNGTGTFMSFGVGLVAFKLAAAPVVVVPPLVAGGRSRIKSNLLYADL